MQTSPLQFIGLLWLLFASLVRGSAEVIELQLTGSDSGSVQSGSEADGLAEVAAQGSTSTGQEIGHIVLVGAVVVVFVGLVAWLSAWTKRGYTRVQLPN